MRSILQPIYHVYFVCCYFKWIVESVSVLLVPRYGESRVAYHGSLDDLREVGLTSPQSALTPAAGLSTDCSIPLYECIWCLDLAARYRAGRPAEVINTERSDPLWVNYRLSSSGVRMVISIS